MGFACGTGGSLLDVRITNSLYRSNAVTLMFIGHPDGLPLGRANDAVLQRSGDTCELALDAFRKGSTVLVMDGTNASLSYVDPQQVVITDPAGRGVSASTGAEAIRILGGMTPPSRRIRSRHRTTARLLPGAREDDGYTCED